MLRNPFLTGLLFILLSACRSPSNLFQEVKPLPSYPSASGIAYRDGKLYVIGDDANQLLILDSSLQVKDSISLYQYPEKRIPKSVKPDLESMTLLEDDRLLLLGSASLAPQRNIAWLIHTLHRQKDSIRLDTFFSRVQLTGIHELNIEGMTAYPGGFILANRGSKGYPKNHLLFTRHSFWTRQSSVEITSMLAGVNTDSTMFSGISGLAYSPRRDALLLTVSTEDTRNSMDDGAIGKSYLWIIRNISSKKNWKAVNPDIIIELDALDSRFIGQKIESVTILKETGKRLYLLLAADNDDGSSTLFKIVVTP